MCVKKRRGKNVRFKNTFLNYFLQDRFYLSDFTIQNESSMDEKTTKNNYLTDKIARVGSRRRPILSYKIFLFSYWYGYFESDCIFPASEEIFKLLFTG